jgi:DNA (cytosine-5)-methyltransferase 1
MSVMMSVKEVATRLKVSEQQVRTLLRKGELDATMVGKQWIIESGALESYIVENDVVVEPDDHPRTSAEVPDVIALSFFSGAMGLDIGMAQAGIEALLACESDKTCRMTIEKNKPDIALIGDINNYSSEQILRMAGIPTGRRIDVIFGGPPCQAFSTAGNRKGFEDTRGNVFLKYIQIVTELEPRYVVIENVRGLLSAPFPYVDEMCIDECMNSDIEPIKGGALLHIVHLLRAAGYTVSFNLYNAANYGAPQIRERVVIIGSLNGSRVPYLRPTHSENGGYGLPKWRTLSDALKALPTNTVHHHVAFPEERLVYYRMLKEGQYWRHLPPELQKKAMGKSYALGGGKTGFYRRLSFDRPSPTLVTNPTMPATDLAHPTEDRPLSVEEYRCIQEFPQSWTICGSLLERYRQIGNAVPIKLGAAIGKAVLDHMRGIVDTEIEGFPYSRYKNTDEASWEREARKNIIRTGCSQQLSLWG